MSDETNQPLNSGVFPDIQKAVRAPFRSYSMPWSIRTPSARLSNRAASR